MSRSFPKVFFTTFFSLFSLPLLSFFLFADDPSPQALIKAGHWKRARALLEQRYPNLSNDAEAAYLLSQVKLAFGDLRRAVELAEKAVALDGSNGNYHFQLAAAYGETAEQASLFSKAFWGRRFKAEADKAAALDPKNVEARLALIEYYLQAPRMMGGGKEKARAMAEEIGKIEPARGFLAQARLAQDDRDTAKEEASYLKGLTTSPRNYDILVSLGNFYALGFPKKFDSAEKLSLLAVKIDPERIEPYSTLAAIYATEQRWRELDSILAEAERRISDDLNPYFRAGFVLLQVGADLPRAERYFRKYLSQEPEADTPTLADAHWRLGLVFEKQGRRPQAVSEIETALRMQPKLQAARKDLGRLKGGR